MDKKVGIIAAMEVEKSKLSVFLKEIKPPVKIAGMEFTEGKIEGTPVVLVKSGVGKVNAALCTQILCSCFSVDFIINSGVAGAMAEGLGIFDLVVSRDTVYHDMNATDFGYKVTEIPQMECSDFVADKKLVQAVKDAFAKDNFFASHKLVEGRIASGDQFVSKPEQKQHIKEICNPACVEMEGAAIAHAAYLNSTPFVIIRCMSDMAEEGGDSPEPFNEEKAADMSARLVRDFLLELK